MANLTITSTTNSILVDFGDMPSEMRKGAWMKSSIISMRLYSDVVSVSTIEDAFEVCHTATAGAMVIDTVNGAAPSSLSDLYTKLIALVA